MGPRYLPPDALTGERVITASDQKPLSLMPARSLEPVGLDHRVCRHAHNRDRNGTRTRTGNRCKRDFHFATFGKIFD